jgi:hypothetical protein
LRLSAVSGVGGSKSLPLFAPETGVGHRVKNAVSKGAEKYLGESTGIIEGKNQLYGDVLVGLKVQD